MKIKKKRKEKKSVKKKSILKYLKISLFEEGKQKPKKYGKNT